MGVEPTPPDDRSAHERQKLFAEIQKADADRRKTELEILELTRWYRRPAILQPLAAIVIGVVTALVGIANGWFSTKLDRLKLAEDTIKRQIADLEAGRTDLNAKIDGLNKERAFLQDQLRKAATDAEQLSLTIERLQPKAASAEKYKSDLDNLRQELARVGERANKAADSAAAARSVSGVVIDCNTGKPAKGVTVFVRVEDGQPGQGTLGTDSQGRFSSPISESIDEISLSVNVPGCQPFRRSVVVRGREDLRLVLQKLKP